MKEHAAFGFNNHDLQSHMSVGYAVGCVVFAAAIKDPDPMGEARRLCDVLELVLQDAGVGDATARAVADNVNQFAREHLSAWEETKRGG